MDSFFTRFRNPLVLLAIVLVQTIALAVQVPHIAVASGPTPDAHRTTVLRYWAVSVAAPLERVGSGTGSTLARIWHNYIWLRHEREQNDALAAENRRLRLEQAAFAEDAAEGRRLAALLKFQQQYIGTTVAAQVIGTSGSDRSRLLTLDKGSDDGLRPDQAVITTDGIVGKLRYVFPHASQLMLISDQVSGAGVMLRDSRIRGILRGSTDGRVEIDSLTADPRIKVGDTVVTSGGDMVYPRGLPVGTVASMTPDPEHQPYLTIRVKPAADLARLEEVLVVTSTQPLMTAAEASDADTADRTTAAGDRAREAQANAQAKLAADQALQRQSEMRAADLVAERLPTAAGPDAKPGDTPLDNTVGGVPNVPHSGVPRVTPALHNDRYSPGATPPADELKPGAAPRARLSVPAAGGAVVTRG